MKLRFRVECEDSAVEPEVHLDAVQFMAARIRFAFTQLMRLMCRPCLRGGVGHAKRAKIFAGSIPAGSSVNDARRQERGWKLG